MVFTEELVVAIFVLVTLWEQRCLQEREAGRFKSGNRAPAKVM